MGRKSLQKARKGPNSKTENWAKTLLPLLQTLKLDSLSMNTLSKLMGVSKSTIYEYFSTKEEIMDYVVAHKIEELHQLKEGLGAKAPLRMGQSQPYGRFSHGTSSGD